MSFQHLERLYLIIPILLVLAILKFWRRPFWGHSLVDQLREELPAPNLIWRFPRLLEGCALAFLVIALLGPVFPFTLNRVERGGLQILFVLDLSQSMEEPARRAGSPPPSTAIPTISPGTPAPNMGSLMATPGSKMEAVKIAAMEFIDKRPGDAMGLVVFSNNGYLVSPPSFDQDSMTQYMRMTGTQALVNEGFTAIGEGLSAANRFFEQQREKARRQAKGNVIILLTDGDNNYGRDPLTEVERARSDGTRIYMVAVQIQAGGTATQIANAVPSTGGRAFDAQNREALDAALQDINDTEKGVFYTLQLRQDEPAYFIFVLLSLACLTARLILHAIPHFVEIS